MIIIEDKKFNDLAIEEAPAKWTERIVKSTEEPWNSIEDRGGYNVQPVPEPLEEIIDKIINIRDETNNQNLKLFNRGNAISGLIKIIGINQFPNPPIITGIIIKKIITKAWAVTKEL